MSVREKSYEDYGVTPDEINLAIKFSRIKQIDNSKTVIETAYDVKAEIATDIYYSIIKGLSYDELSKKNYIPIPRGDFYAYRRKTIAMIALNLRDKEKDDVKYG